MSKDLRLLIYKKNQALSDGVPNCLVRQRIETFGRRAQMSLCVDVEAVNDEKEPVGIPGDEQPR